MSALRTPWACPSCQFVESADGRYCRRCGEERPSNGGAFEGAIRWWETLTLLVTRPGQLTRNHSRGRRRRSVPPLSLFLAVNLLFIAGQALSGFQLLPPGLSALLDGHSGYDHAQQMLAQATVVTVVPLFALVSVAVVFGRREPYGTHLVFALHFHAWLLLMATGLHLLLALVLRAGRTTGWVPGAHGVEVVAATALLAGAAGYLLLACGRVFDTRTLQRLLTGTLLTATALALLLLHRQAVFVLSAWLA